VFYQRLCHSSVPAGSFLTAAAMASVPSLNQSEKKKKKNEKNHKLSDLKTLGLQLLSSRAHINNLPLLLTFLSPSKPPQYVLEALLSLQSFFITVLPSLPSSSKPAADVQDDAELIYRTWLRSKFDELVKSLIDVAVSSECDDTLKVAFRCFANRCVVYYLLCFGFGEFV